MNWFTKLFRRKQEEPFAPFPIYGETSRRLVNGVWQITVDPGRYPPRLQFPTIEPDRLPERHPGDSWLGGV